MLCWNSLSKSIPPKNQADVQQEKIQPRELKFTYLYIFYMNFLAISTKII